MPGFQRVYVIPFLPVAIIVVSDFSLGLISLTHLSGAPSEFSVTTGIF